MIRTTLKVGAVYKTKKKHNKFYIGFSTDHHIEVGQNEIFTVLKNLTDLEEDEWADYSILYNNKIYCLSVKVVNWKAVGYDFEAIC